jgi:spermidine synthase
MTRWYTRLLALACTVMAVTACAESTTSVIHTEKSAFENIVVYEQAGERCMKFGSVQAPGRQSCYAIAAPQRLIFDYTRMMLGALYVKPDPARIMIVGLGGGSLPSALHTVLPRAVIDTVEIDPAVVSVAKKYFNFKPEGTLRVHVADGRAFVQQALKEGRRYDIVMLDAFGEDYIPPHLLTREFLQEVKGILAPGGVVAANTFTASRVYDDESSTYAEVFGAFYNLRAGNRIILAGPGPLVPMEQLRSNAAGFEKRLMPLGVDATALLARFSTRKDWAPSGKVLTD